MNVDPSTSNFHRKRNANSDRFTGPKFQRINHIQEYEDGNTYEEKTADVQAELEEEANSFEQVNFLRESPSSLL